MWNMIGTIERDYASNLYRLACLNAVSVYGTNNIKCAEVLREFAIQLEQRHCERGRPEYSKWNRAAAVPEDSFSIEARQMNREAKEIYKQSGYNMAVEVADISISIAKLIKRD